jgi:pimeloyl-ACP methyl ester carboxylesterase
MAIVLLVALLPGCGRGSSTALELDACTLDGVAARCGTMMIPEDRSDGEGGRELPIRVVVFPATTSDPKPDPVVWFAGGPGDSAVDTIDRVRPLLAASTDRDLVFIEQRGTGASALTCPAFPEGSDPAALGAAVQSCLDSLDGDPRMYTTSMFADDVDEILTELEYPQVNLVGISYGATAEQVFLSRHPERVRTMTLVSGTLLDVPVLERFPVNAQRALDNVFAACEQQAACHEAFPLLRDDWDALWQSITAAPWVVPEERSPSGDAVVFDADRLAAGLHDLLFVATTHSRIPLLVHTLGATDDKVAAILAVARAYPDVAGTSEGAPLLGYLIRCNEEWARFDPRGLVGADTFEYGKDRKDAERWQSICAHVPEASDAGGAAAGPPSQVPVLALNGENDPQDPPANMAGAADLWPNSRSLTVPGQGHDIDPASARCIVPLIESFIRRGSAAGLDTSCLTQLVPTDFDLALPDD